MNQQESVEQIVERLKAAGKAEAEKAEARRRELAAETAAKQAEKEQQQTAAERAQAAQRLAAAAAAFDARFKLPALEAWTRQGGEPAEFYRLWPEEAAKIRMTEARRQEDAARADQARLYADL